MKLAEALQARADLNTRIAQLRSRLNNNALVQEGETTTEDPAALLSQMDSCIAELEDLIRRINLTNSTVKTEGKTLTEWIAARDALTLKLSVYRDVVETAGSGVYRARGSEIRILPAVNVTALQKEVDAMAKELRQTDNLIQAANWANDLI